MRLAIRHRLFITMMSAIVVFVVAVNYFVLDVLDDMTHRQIVETVESSVVAYRRFEKGRRELYRIQANALSQVAHLKATLSIPGLDAETVSYAGQSLRGLADMPVTLILDDRGALLVDVNNSGIPAHRLVGQPGLSHAQRGESYYGIWSIGDIAYRVGISPVISGEILVGIVVVGEQLGIATDVKVLEDLASVDVALIIGRKLSHPRPGTLDEASETALLTVAQSWSTETRLGVSEVSTPIGSYYAAVVPHAQADSGAVLFYVSRDQFAASLDSVRTFILAASILSVLLAAWGSVRVANKISSPLGKLTAAAEAYGRGEFDVPLSVTSKDEVGTLAEAFTTMARDIAASREDLIASKEAAEASSRAKGTFLATMSHEIRTPLNGVIGMANLLRKTELSPKQAHFCAAISSSSKALFAILNDVLDFSKIEAGQLQIETVDVDLHDLVEETVQLFAQSAAAKNLDLICDIRLPHRLHVRSDPFRLRQVLTNLLSNAIKFTDEGFVQVSVEELGCEDGSATVRFEAIDTGMGMSDEALEGVFESFVQADGSMSRRFGGTGLGLSISRQIVELMDGELCVESTLGEGSRFWFDLRLNITARQVEVLRYGIENRRVRVLDPNEPRRKMITALLKRWGLQAVDDENYDLLLIDSAADRPIVTESTPVIRMIDVTNLEHETDDSVANADKTVLKPIQHSELLNSITDLLCEASVVQPRLTVEDAHPYFEALSALLVEDNLLNQEVAAESLAILGVSVTVANNGQEAVELFERYAPDFVLMDCQMPVMDGYEATREIRRIEEGGDLRTPIIALTANSMSGDREQCLACGMDDFLSKPFELTDLAAVMERWFESTDSKNLKRSHRAIPQVLSPIDDDANLNAAAIDSLRSIGKARGSNILGKVIAIYRQQAPELLAKIDESLATQNFDELALFAHTLKSSSASLGASQLADMCAELEVAGRKQSLAECGIGHEELQVAYDSVAKSLESISQGCVNVVDTPVLEVDDAKQILIVDDDPAFRLVATEALIDSGFVVAEAHDGLGAILQAQQNRPDLVLMDAVMPGVDGFETCRRFRDDPKLADVPILMSTGLNDPRSVDRAFDFGASGFVTKPIQHQVLGHHIRFMIRASETAVELRESRSRLAIAQRMARLGYWTWNTESGELTMSEELRTLCGIRKDQKVESLHQFAELIDEENWQQFDSDLQRAIEERVAVDADYRLRPHSGMLLHVHQQLNVECPPSGPVVVVATVQDVTAQRTAEEKVRKLAYFDSLTGLASRSYLYQRLSETIKSARRRDQGFALFFMDLDGFKDINDSLGHDEGDALLKIVAGRLTETLRDTDFLSRLGGDEFCMLITDASDEMHIGQIATRCLQCVEATVDLADRSIRPQVSIGISRFPEDGHDTHTLLRAADSAMYAAKQSGKHRFEFFDCSMTLKAGERLALAQDLRNALHNKEFELYYQPQIDLISGTAVSYEALVRWNHPARGLLPPNEFVAEMERLGLIKDLGDWAIHEACRQIVLWRDEGMGDVRISVNIAPTHFQCPNLVTVVRNVLHDSGVAPECLELEVTETSIQHDRTLTVFKELKAIGVSIAIDDFGSGYSSLGSLQHLPIDCLKIDRVFIKDILNNPKDAVLLGTIMTLAHALGFRVVAEGVEELEQIQILRALDCDIVQGFYFSRPVPADAISELATRAFLPDFPAIKQLGVSQVH